MRNVLADRLGESVEVHPTLEDVVTVEVKGPVERQQCEKALLLDLGCAEAVLRGADVFVPGVLASTSSFQPGEHLSLFFSPESLLRGTKLVSVPADSVFLGNGVAQLSRSAVFGSASGLAVRVTEGVYETSAVNGLLPDRLFSQHLPSTVAGHVLAPTAQDVVLDMCAAPGGKTTHISTLMRNGGRVVALERSKKRCEALRDNLRVWGARNVQVEAADASKASKLFPAESFTKVLLDAPCTCLGQRPQLQPRKVDAAAAASFQRRLLQEAAALLRGGGRLVYSTCTITMEENEQTVEWALRHLPLQLTAQVPFLGSPTGPQGLCQFFDPTQFGVGFFIACFTKKTVS